MTIFVIHDHSLQCLIYNDNVIWNGHTIFHLIAEIVKFHFDSSSEIIKYSLQLQIFINKIYSWA